MSDWNDVFEDSADDLIEEIGDLDASYTDRDGVTVPLPCILTLDAQLQGEDLQTLIKANTIEFKTSTGHKPKHGEIIRVDGKDWTVENTYSDDGIYRKLVVK